MALNDRIDRLERTMGGDEERHICGDGLPPCDRPDLPHDRFTFTIQVGDCPEEVEDAWPA